MTAKCSRRFTMHRHTSSHGATFFFENSHCSKIFWKRNMIAFTLVFWSCLLLCAEAQNTIVNPPEIAILTAEQPDGSNVQSVYDNGCKMRIQFDISTNLAGWTLGQTLPKSDVDALFVFSVSLGADYQGSWTSAGEFVVVVNDFPGAGPPQVGEPNGMTVTCRNDPSRAIRAEAPLLSNPCESTSPKMLGDFGPEVITFSRIEAVGNAAVLGDSIYGNGVQIIAHLSEDTNLAGYEPVGTVLSSFQMSTFLSFSDFLGLDYSATFTDRSTLVIDVIDSTGGLASIGSFYMTAQPDQSYGLRNFPAASAPSTAVSPALSGNFGPANVHIVSAIASDPTNLDLLYGVDDSITVTFNRDTNMAGYNLNTPLNPAQTSTFLDFSQAMGTFTGVWLSQSVFVLTVTDTAGSAPPEPGVLNITVKASGNLRNFPPTAAPSQSSMILSGNFGQFVPSIVSLTARDPRGADAVYGPGDELVIGFDRGTNRAGFSIGQVVPREVVDNLFLFSHVLGTNYTGRWDRDDEFVITIRDASTSQQPLLNVLFSRCRKDESIPNSLILEADWSDGACFDLSPILTGDFGPSDVEFTFTGSPSIGKTGDSIYAADDTLTLVFNQETNMNGYLAASLLGKTAIDQMLLFSRSIGGDYTGQWVSRSEFVITVVDPSGAVQPLPDFLEVSFTNSSNLRNNPPQCAPLRPDQTSVLRGNFGPAVIEVVSVTASDPTDSASEYNEGDVVTIAFNQNTNQGLLPSTGVTKEEIDNLFLFSHTLGADYSGAWPSASEFVITVLNVSLASPPTIDDMFVTILPEGNLRNAPGASAPQNKTFDSIKLDGDFGPSNIFIIDLVAEDPFNLDETVGPPDTVLIVFSRETSQGRLPSSISKQEVDSLLTFSESIGSDYTGEWQNSGSRLLLSILNGTGANPVIGSTTVTMLASGNVRNVPPTCRPSTATSPVIRGDFGRTIPYMTAVVGDDPINADQVFGFLDTITITFSEDTDRGGYNLGAQLPMANLLEMLEFSQDLGTVSAFWSSNTVLVITVQSTVGASPPSIGSLMVRCKGPYQLPFSAPADLVLDPFFQAIRSTSGSKPCFRESPVLTGDFGPSLITIQYILGISSAVPDSVFGPLDQIEIKFSEDTSMGGYVVDQVLSTSQIDTLFIFSCGIGALYTGTWLTPQRFMITMVDTTGACNPIVDEFTITTNPDGDIRNSPPQSAPNNVISPPLTGDFGPSPATITSVFGTPGTPVDSEYGAGDTITIQFSHDTDQAGLSGIISKAELEALFDFNTSLGIFFFGEFTQPNELVITIQDGFGATPPSLGCVPAPIACVGAENTVIGSLRSSGNLRSLPKITAPMTASAPTLTGSFGSTALEITTLEAVAADADGEYTAMDLINVTFNLPTNKAFLPDELTKDHVDWLISPSASFGAIYGGRWVSRSLLSIYVVDPRTSGPPQIGNFFLGINPNAGLMEHPPVTEYSGAVSPTLIGNFGPSPLFIRAVTAMDADDLDSVYSAQDAITIYFSENTNKADAENDPFFSQVEVDRMLVFSQNIGTTYSGLWLDRSSLRVTIQDPTGADPPVLGILTVRVRACLTYNEFSGACVEDEAECSYCACCLGDLRNFPPTSAPTFVTSPALGGGFGSCRISIINATAWDPSGTNRVLSVGDRVDLVFSEPTDKACGPLYLDPSCENGKRVTKEELDSLLVFSHRFGLDYSGVWETPTLLSITVHNLTDTEIVIGEMQATFFAVPGIRNLPPNCAPSDVISPVLVGNWGMTTPFILNFSAFSAAGSPDSVYGAGDEFVIDFCVPVEFGTCMDTNMFGFSSGVWLLKTDVDRMFSFSSDLGADYEGQWETPLRFRIRVADATNATPPAIHDLTVSVRHEGTCTCDNSRCTTYTCPTGFFGLRDSTLTSDYSAATSAPLVGDFGDSELTIIGVEARDGQGGSLNRSETLGAYGPGDNLTVSFSSDTSYGRGPGGCTEERTLWPGEVLGSDVILCRQFEEEFSKEQVDLLFSTSQSLGAAYSGVWVDRRTFTITIINATGAGPPFLGLFTLTTRSQVKLRNYPDASVPAAVTSPPLQGTFGPSTVEIARMIASDTTSSSWEFDAGDRITIVFNKPTDRAQYGTSTLSKAQVDELIYFATDHASSQQVSLGADYSAVWSADDTLEIDIINASGASPPTIPDPLALDGSMYSLPHLAAIGLGFDSTLYQVQWTEDCVVFSYGCSANGRLLHENFNDFDDVQRRYNLLVAAQTNLSLLLSNDLPCNYPDRPLATVRDVVLMRGGSVLAASLWAQIRPEAGLRDVLSTEASSESSTRGQVPLVGDFGASELSIASLEISGSKVDDDVFGAGDEVRISFSGDTNMAYIPAGFVVGKAVINTILTCETASTYNDISAAFQAKVCNELGIDGSSSSQKLLMGRYALQSQTYDGRALYLHEGGSYYLYSFCNETTRIDVDCPRWHIGTSVGSVIAGLYSSLSADSLDVVGATSWMGFNGSMWVPEPDITVTCLDGGVSWSASSSPAAIDGGESESVEHPCDALGADYIASWEGRRELVIQITDAGGLVGSYDAGRAENCSGLPDCAVVSESAPKLGQFFVKVREEGWVRHFPQTSARTSLDPPGPVVSSPFLTGSYGELTPVITRLVAVPGDYSADSVFSPGDAIRVEFSVPTDMAGLASCDPSGDRFNVDRTQRQCCVGEECSAPPLRKEEVDALFDFAVPLGSNYTARWRWNATVLEITAVDTAGAGPLGVGHFRLSSVTARGLAIRTADGISSGVQWTSPLLEGSFGKPAINVSALVGSDPRGVSSRYENGDRITVSFSEATNKGELTDAGLTRVQLDNLLSFSLPLGLDYTGRWTDCQTLQITITNTSGAPPPLPGYLTVSIRPEGNLRNFPPQAAPSSGQFDGTLTGDFGPAAVEIVRLRARDGGAGSSRVDVGDAILVSFNQLTDRGGRSVGDELLKREIDAFLSFSQRIGSNYTGRWLNNTEWSTPVAGTTLPAFPTSKEFEITITDPTDTAPPTIDTLTVTVLPTANLRNVPPVCAPSTSTSPTLTGDFGPSAIAITALSARGDVNCAAACDSEYGEGDVIDLVFSEDVTLCLGSCACEDPHSTDPLCARPRDGAVNMTELQRAMSFSQSLGAEYQGLWLSHQRLRITVLNATGAAPPTVYSLSVEIKPESGLRNYPPTGDVSTPQSNALCATLRDAADLSCGFGVADIFIEKVVAEGGRMQLESTFGDLRGRVTVGDQIVIQFNAATNRGSPMLCVGGTMAGTRCLSASDSETCRDRVFDPRVGGIVLLATGGECRASPLPAGTTLAKQTVDALFEFSHTLAYNYTGTWRSACLPPTLAEPCSIVQDRQFVITVTAIGPEGGCSRGVEGCPSNSLDTPSVGCASCINVEPFVVTMRQTADIRNIPAASVPSSSDAPPMEGSLGSSVVEIEWLIADDPESRYDWYNPGDTLTVVFSEPTNLAGLPPSGLSKADIDAVLEFSEPLGADYSGRWKCGRSSESLCKSFELYSDPSAAPGTAAVNFSRWALEITVLDITGVAGLSQCADQINGCNDASIDLNSFSVALRSGGPFVGSAWASATAGAGPGLRNHPAQSAPSAASKSGVDGQFGRTLVVYGVSPTRLPAVGGYITVTGKGFGRTTDDVDVLIGGEPATALTLPSGWTFPVPDEVPQSLVALAPPGTGARGRTLVVQVQFAFSTERFTAALEGLLFFAAPRLAAVSPTALRLPAVHAFTSPAQFLLTLSGANFGPGPPRSPDPQVLLHPSVGGVELCGNVTRLSDAKLLCIHAVDPAVRARGTAQYNAASGAREAGAPTARVVVVVDGQSSEGQSPVQLSYEALPAFWGACTPALSGECVDCCEAECLFESESQGLLALPAGTVQGRCKLQCMDFCGFAHVQWRSP